MSEVAMLNDLAARQRTMERTDRSYFKLRAMAAWSTLLGRRGSWAMGGFDSAGNATDLSGLAHHLTYNGNPTYNYDVLAPYLDLDGTGDYLSHADHADFDILGTEAYVAAGAQGLTCAGWFWFDAIDAATEYLIAKGQLGVGGSYVLRRLSSAGATAAIRFEINGGGGGLQADSAVVITAGQWYFIAGRYIPSTTVAVVVGNTVVTAATAAAALNNTAFNLTIGGDSVGAANTLLDGRVSGCGLLAAAQSDSAIIALYQQTRALYGV